MLTADVKLRNEVLRDPNIVLITNPGFSDKVVKIVPLPECVKQFREEQLSERRQKSEFKDLQHVELDMSKGPHQEMWRNMEREIFVKADRDKPFDKPADVNAKIGDPWAMSPEDVPVINLFTPKEKKDTPEVPEARVEGLMCDCGFKAKTSQGLKVHQAKHKAMVS